MVRMDSLVLLLILAVGFPQLRRVPSIPNFLGVFVMKGCWVLLNTFSTFTERIVFPFLLHGTHGMHNVD